MHHRGVRLGGDEPSYIGESYALGRLHTWNLGAAFSLSAVRHLLGVGRSYELYVLSHGVQFPSHAIGFSLVLAPSLALVASLSAVHVELLVLLCALVVWLGVEVTRFARVPRTWLLVVVALFLAPGFLVATTQVYPDLLSGLLLAVIIVRLMVVERDGPSSVGSLAVTSTLVFAFVWLDDKNIVVGLIVGTIAALIARRRGASRREVLALTGIALLGVVGVVAFNLYAYGHPLGAPQGLDAFSGASLDKIAALVFDRGDGILVQSPVALLGLVGALRWRRHAPLSISAGALAVAVLFWANASVAGGMSGASFSGRYQWEALPLALGLGGLILLELATKRPRIAAVVLGVVLLLAVDESWAVFTSRPNASSFVTYGWDPATYVSWWGRLDPSPILNYALYGWSNARNLWGLGTLTALAVAVALALVASLGRVRRLARIAAAAAVFAVFCWGMTLTSPFMLPTAMHYTASDLGPLPLRVPGRAVRVEGSQRHGTILFGPRLEVLPGRYRITVSYALSDPSPHAARLAAVEVGKGARASSAVYLRSTSSPEATRQSVAIEVAAPGELSAALTWRGTGRLTVWTVSIAKVATCSVVDCEGGLL